MSNNQILEIISGNRNYSGIESYTDTQFERIDTSKFNIDFLFLTFNSLRVIPKLKSYETSSFVELKTQYVNNGRGSILGYIHLILDVRKYVSQKDYSVYHIQTAGIFDMAASIFALPKNRIIISHVHGRWEGKSSFSVRNYAKMILRKICMNYIKKRSNYMLANSYESGMDTYGNNANFLIAKNAINIDEFIYNPAVRDKIRHTDKTVFGHVGRLSRTKNQMFVIDVFKIINSLDKNTELWLVGDGEMYPNILTHIKELGLEKNVTMFGEREDVNELMQGMDALLFPSLYEGLGIVAIEAQAAGLPVFASTMVPREAKITDKIFFLELSSGAEVWSSFILDTMKIISPRCDMSRDVEKAGYSVVSSARQLEELYNCALNKDCF